jgi:hypothetical protein
MVQHSYWTARESAECFRQDVYFGNGAQGIVSPGGSCVVLALQLSRATPKFVPFGITLRGSTKETIT